MRGGAIVDRVEGMELESGAKVPERHKSFYACGKVVVSIKDTLFAAGKGAQRRVSLRALLGIAAAIATATAPAALPATAYATEVAVSANDQADAVVVNVRDYGAIANSGEDAEPGIVKALEEAKRHRTRASRWLSPFRRDAMTFIPTRPSGVHCTYQILRVQIPRLQRKASVFLSRACATSRLMVADRSLCSMAR